VKILVNAGYLDKKGGRGTGTKCWRESFLRNLKRKKILTRGSVGGKSAKMDLAEQKSGRTTRMRALRAQKGGRGDVFSRAKKGKKTAVVAEGQYKKRRLHDRVIERAL